MSHAGPALMGIGMASGDHRALEAAQNAVSSQLLETSINGASRVLVNVTSGNDLTLAEFTEAADQISQLCDQKDANIIYGWVPDASMDGEVRITVLATGFGQAEQQAMIAGNRTNAVVAPRPTQAPATGQSEPAAPRTGSMPPPVPAKPGDAPTSAAPATPGATPGGAPPAARQADARKSTADELDIPAFLRRR